MLLSRFTFLGFILMFLALATYAEPAPSKVINLQQMMISQCEQQAVELKMTNAASARKMCTCTIGVQAKQLTLGEFWMIQSATANGQNPEKLPAVKRIQPSLNLCYKNIKLNSPQFPAARAIPPSGK